MNWIIRYVFIIILCCCLQVAKTQSCLISQDIVLPANDSTLVSLDIEGLVNDQLDQGNIICGIRLFFEHPQVENLRITLVSPSGQTITLVGPGTISSGLTQAVEWNVAFLPCGGPAAPDPGFSAQWNNAQPWASFSMYTGAYYPNNGCFEDFNLGSANGTWSLMIENLGPLDGQLSFFEIIFCDPTGISCEPCYLSAGKLQEEFYTTCQQDINLRDLSSFLSADPIIDVSQSFEYILTRNDSILAYDAEITESDTLPPGRYTICGIAYSNEDESIIKDQVLLSDLQQIIDFREACADLTNPCFILDVSPVQNIINIDTTVCSGDTLLIQELRIFDDLDTNILRANQISCDSLIRINVKRIELDAAIVPSANEINCGESIFLNGNSSSSNCPIDQFNWTSTDGNFLNNLGPIAQVDDGGTYSLSIESGACVDSTNVSIATNDNLELQLDSVLLDCSLNLFQVNFNANQELENVAIDGPGTLEIDINLEFFTAILGGRYYIEATRGNCTVFDSIDLRTTAADFDIEVSSTLIDCDNPTSMVQIITDALNPELVFSGPENISDNVVDFILNTAGDYQVTVTDQDGCSNSAAFEILGGSDLPQYVISDLERSCNEASVGLNLQIDTPFDSVLWSGPNSFMSNELNPIPIDTGVYQVEIFGENGCNTNASLVYSIENVVPLTSLLLDTLDCRTDTVDICLEQTDLVVDWILNDTVIGQGICVELNKAGLYDYTFLDNNGCFGEGQFELIDISSSIPQVNGIPTQLTLGCLDTIFEISPQISSANEVSVSWFFQDSLIQNREIIQINESGLYTFETIDLESACSTINTLEVLEDVPEWLADDIVFEIIPAPCAGDSATLIASGTDFGVLEALINNNPISLESSYLLPSGTYEVVLSDDQGCSRTFDILIEDILPLEIDLGEDVFGAPGDIITLSLEVNRELTQIANINWSSSDNLSCDFCLDPELTITENGLLLVEITDENGCISTDSLNIFIDEETNIYIPNIFSPESQSGNEKMWIYLSSVNVKVFDLSIFDRWGNLVIFHAEISGKQNIIWDGQYRGEDAEQGVYFFTAKVVDATNQEKLISGHITLLR